MIIEELLILAAMIDDGDSEDDRKDDIKGGR